MLDKGRGWSGDESKYARDASFEEFRQRYPNRSWTAYRVHRMRKWNLGSGGKVASKSAQTAKVRQLRQEQAPVVSQPSRVEEARTRLVNATLNRESRSFYEEQGTNLELFDQLSRSIKSLPAPRSYAPRTRRNSDRAPQRTLCLLYSDAHRGQRSESKALGGLGGYNLEVWKQRHDRLRDAVLEAQEMFQADELRILGLGDLIDGQDIFKSQPFHIEEPVTDQIIGAAYRLAEDTDAYAQMFQSVSHEYVYGNHARVGRKGETPYAVNYEHLTYEIAKQATKDHRNVSWSPSDAWFKLVSVHDTRFVLVHGDDVRSYGGSPFSGMRRSKAQYVAMLNQPFDYLCVGHHHQAFSDEHVLANGSFVGASEFTAKILSVAGVPSQKIFVVEPGAGVTWTHDVSLATADELRRATFG